MDFKMEQQHKNAPESFPILNLDLHKNSVECLQYYPLNPAVLISGSFDHTVAFWDLSAGMCIKQIQAHRYQLISRLSLK